jgi:hypothetical protein
MFGLHWLIFPEYQEKIKGRWKTENNDVSKENMSFENQSEIRKRVQFSAINQEPGRVPKEGLYLIIYLK